MAKRDPRMDPQPGDALKYKRYRIEVTGRDGCQVSYAVVKRGMRRRTASQELSEWVGWASGARIAENATERGGECIPTRFASGPCEACRKPAIAEVHMFKGGLWHPECCPARKHGKPPRKARPTVEAVGV